MQKANSDPREAVFLINKQGIIQTWNKNASVLYEVNRKKTQNLPIWELFQDEYIPVLRYMLDDMNASKVRTSVEIVHQSKNGEDHHVQMTMMVANDLSTSSDLIIVHSIEIGESVPQIDPIVENADLFRMVAENSVDVIWRLNFLLRFTFVTPSILPMTGFTPEEWVGSRLSDHATRKEFLRMATLARRSLNKEFEDIVFEAKMLKKNGDEFAVEITSKLIYNEYGLPIGLQGSTRDITRRKAAEEQAAKRNKSIAQLYRAGKELGRSLYPVEIYAKLFPIFQDNFSLDQILIAQFDQDTGQLIPVYSASKDHHTVENLGEYLNILPKKKPDVIERLRKEQQVYFDNIHENRPQYRGLVNVRNQLVPIAEADSQEIKTQSILVVPLSHDNKLIGAIQIFSNQIDNFSGEDRDFLAAFSSQLSAAIVNAELFDQTQESRNNLEKALEGMISTMVAAIEIRDPYTASHQIRVSALAVEIGRKFNLTASQLEGLKMAGLVHDMGKIRVPIEILSKPGKLSDMEFEMIKDHARVGSELLSHTDYPWPLSEIVLQHHERWDGTGYPNRISGENIHLEARILSVSDVVEAMSHHRPYRAALGIDRALQEIREKSGTQFDPQVVEKCLELFEGGFQFPEM